MSNPYQYWATLPADELAKRAMDKVRAYRKWYVLSGYAERARRGWLYANGWTDAKESSARLQMGGEGGNLVKAVVNTVRPLRQRTVAMVLSGAAEMVPIASNSDAAAREQVDLSKGVDAHVARTHRLEARDRKVLEMALDMGEAFLVSEWDATLGRPTNVKPVIDEATGQPKVGEDDQPEVEPSEWEGDFRFWVASAFDVYRDVGLREWDGAKWGIVREWGSRWEWAAKFPEKAEEILKVGESRPLKDEFDLFDPMMAWDPSATSDMIPVYKLWHRDSRELPGGREFVFLDNGTWLTDGSYPYDGEGLPMQRLTSEDVSCTSLGYSNFWDVLGMSDLINSIVSAGATNVTTGAVPPLLNPSGSGLKVGAPVGTGHKVLDISKMDAAPGFMEAPQMPAEAWKLLEILGQFTLAATGLNETSLGRPPFSGMAAQAMALLDAKADEYQDGLRKGFLAYKAQAATHRLRILKRYANSERVAQIAGKSKQWMAKSFSAKSLELVDGFHVEPVNPASRTQAGRLGLLETLANFNVPLRPEQIIELLQTGQYESDFEATTANRYRIKEENELLMDGQMPPILMARTHWLDIPEHLALLNSPSIVDRPDVVQAVLDTVTAKLEQWRNMPPDLLSLLGGPVPPMPGQLPGMAMPGAAVPPGEAQPPQGAPDAGAAEAAMGGPAAEPNLPSPPPEAGPL